MRIETKICGLGDPHAVDAALDAGARFCGLVFYPPSPRSLAIEVARALALRIGDRATRVGVFVDPDDDLLAAVRGAVPLDYVQLHGRETPARCKAVAGSTGCGVIKAVSVARAADIANATAYLGAAERILFDAKPPKDDANALPGGNARVFDWRLFHQARLPTEIRWFLSGGLTVDNVAEAIKIAGARAVDVSSGVESAPGKKDPNKIRAFLSAVDQIAQRGPVEEPV